MYKNAVLSMRMFLSSLGIVMAGGLLLASGQDALRSTTDGDGEDTVLEFQAESFQGGPSESPSLTEQRAARRQARQAEAARQAAQKDRRKPRLKPQTRWLAGIKREQEAQKQLKRRAERKKLAEQAAEAKRLAPTKAAAGWRINPEFLQGGSAAQAAAAKRRREQLSKTAFGKALSGSSWGKRSGDVQDGEGSGL